MAKKTTKKNNTGNGDFQVKLAQDVFNKLFKVAIDKKKDVNLFIEEIMKKYDVTKGTVVNKMKSYREESDPVAACLKSVSSSSGERVKKFIWLDFLLPNEFRRLKECVG